MGNDVMRALKVKEIDTALREDNAEALQQLMADCEEPNLKQMVFKKAMTYQAKQCFELIFQEIEDAETFDPCGNCILTAAESGYYFLSQLLEKGFKIKNKTVSYNKYSILHVACGKGAAQSQARQKNGITPAELPKILCILIGEGASALASAKRQVLPIDVLANQIGWISSSCNMMNYYNTRFVNLAEEDLAQKLPYSTETHQNIFRESFQILIRQMVKEQGKSIDGTLHLKYVFKTFENPLKKLKSMGNTFHWIKTSNNDDFNPPTEEDRESLEIAIQMIAHSLNLTKIAIKTFIDEIALGNVSLSTKQTMIDMFTMKTLPLYYKADVYIDRVYGCIMGTLKLLLTNGCLPTLCQAVPWHFGNLQNDMQTPVLRMVLKVSDHKVFSFSISYLYTQIEWNSEKKSSENIEKHTSLLMDQIRLFKEERTLKYLCRCTMYQHIQHNNVNKYKDCLGLPSLMQQFLVAIDE